MGIADDFGVAFAKAMDAAGHALPAEGNVFMSVKDRDKRGCAFLGRKLADLGFGIVATHGTYATLKRAGVPVQRIEKIGEGRPDVLDALKNGEIALIINTPSGKGAHTDEARIRREALGHAVPILTSISAAAAALNGIAAMRDDRGLQVKSLQEHHSG